MSELDLLKNEKNSLIGGESITPNPKPFGQSSTEFYDNDDYKIFTGLDYLSLNIPVEYPKEIEKVNAFKKILKIDTLPYDEIIRKSKSSNHIVSETHKYDESTSIHINDSVSHDRDLTRIELKGAGCRDFEFRHGDHYLQGYHDLLFKTIELGGWGTRIDIFIDVINGDITTKELDDKIRNCEYTCSSRKFRADGTKNCDDYSDDGWGYLFGQPGSGTVVRLYDKKAEQISKGKTINEHVRSWLRIEIRFYHNVAKTMLLELLSHLQDFSNFALGILKSVIEFKNYSLDSHKYRWPVWEKWSKLLQDIKKIPPYIADQFKNESSIAISSNWYSRSATKIHEIDRFVMSKEDYYLLEIQNKIKGLEKIVGSNATLNEINKERLKRNLPVLFMKDLEEELKAAKLELDSYSLADDDVIKRFSRDIYDDIGSLV